MTDCKRNLIGDLANADADVRRRAMFGLGVGDESDLPAFLIGCLSSTDKGVGWAAMAASLGRLGTTRATDPLTRLMIEEDDIEISGMAREALARLREVTAKNDGL